MGWVGPLSALALAGALQDKLPRVEPTPPERAVASFKIAEGLRIERVAAEPLLRDPVDMAFDEDGRLFVVEMADYPYDEREGIPPRGAVRLLEDPDGDGRFDRSFVYADGLRWPTGLALWEGGVYVMAAPDLIYLKDTDGDRRADRREVVLTGFGRDNVQALANTPRWGLDNWFTGAGGQEPGRIRSPLRPDLPAVEVHGRDFRFRSTGRFEALSGGDRFGNTFDDFGRRFRCSPSTPVRHVAVEDPVLRRNPHLAVGSTVPLIVPEGPSGPIYPASPPEPWRLELTRMLVAGERVEAIVSLQAGSKASGFFTGASGILVYRGGALGPAYDGDIFVGEVAGNLVHRRKLVPDGASFRAERTEPDLEFLVSTDPWFRPVNLVNGPDGALYICDMYRECIEHPWSIPQEIKRRLDLMSGSDRGRIWRVAAKGARPYERPRLGGAGALDLVAALDRPDAWWRETAGRLIFERQDRSAVGALERLAARSERPASRAAALWALEGLGALRESVVAGALRDPSPGVREQAVRLASVATLLELDDPDPRVRFHLAVRMGETDDPRAVVALARWARGADSWTQTAVLASAAARPVELLGRVIDEPIASRLAAVIGARNRQDEIASAFALARGRPDVAVGLAEGLARAGRSFADLDGAEGMLREAGRVARDAGWPLQERIRASRLLGFGSFAAAREALGGLLEPSEPPELRAAAAGALVRFGDSQVGDLLTARWEDLPASARDGTVRWFAAGARLPRLLEAVERGRIPVEALDAGVRRRLLGDPDLAPRAREALRAQPSADRRAVFESFRPALAKAGEPERGREVFRRLCAACHRIGGEGVQVGPDAAAMRAKSPPELLEQILDPNRAVDPRYQLYQILTTDGRLLDGLLAEANASSLRLQRAQGQEEVLLRAQVLRIVPSGISLMPEGLEKGMDAQQMADLIAFIRR
jgi:putative membrane-bound dehydrogenase-like protein